MNSYVFIFSLACMYSNICILASICVCIRMHRRRLALLYILDGAFSRRLLKQFRLCFNHIIQPLWRRTFHTKFVAPTHNKPHGTLSSSLRSESNRRGAISHQNHSCSRVFRLCRMRHQREGQTQLLRPWWLMAQ